MAISLQEIIGQSDKKKAVEAATSLFNDRRPAGAKANTAFAHGDHWQKGKGWIGAKPLLTAPGSSQTMIQIEEGFVSENVIGEVDDRHIGGILGREVNWDFVTEEDLRLRRAKQKAEKDASAKAADEDTTEWWNDGRPKNKLKEALLIALNEERALLRLFIPKGLRNDNGEIDPRPPSIPLALDFIHLQVVYADQGGVFTDTDTERPFGLYVKQTDDNKTIVEVSWVDKGMTHLQQISNDSALETEPFVCDLGGRLWMYELSRPPLITEQVRSNQKSLNLSLTMMMRNVNLAGNLERVIMNAERPKKKVRTTADNPSGFTEQIVDGDFLVGPGATNVLTGLLIKDNDGKIIGRANPNISYRDPVPIDTFVGTRDQFYASILGQTQQIHALISKDATASGVSREQARAEFESSLRLSKEVVDDAGRWLLEAPLRLAAYLCNQTEKYKGLRCDFDSVIETGAISSETRTSNRDDVRAGLMSRETAMVRNGQEDVDAEKERIAQEKKEAAPGIPPPSGDEPPMPKPPGMSDEDVIQ